jgi:Zn ribbon nucleic-acid-binding protein
MALVPPDPACAVCSKPVRSDTLVLYRHGDLFHLACRSHATQSLDAIDRAQTAHQGTTDLIEAAKHQRAARAPKGPNAAASTCPLCTAAATVTDWRHVSEWIAVEDCACGGYFIWMPMIERVRVLPDRDRQALVRRVRDFRKGGHEAWFATTNGVMTGPLVIRTSQRPM